MPIRLFRIATLAGVALYAGTAAASPVEQLTLMAFNTWHGTAEMNDGVAKAVDAIQDSGADIVALQESADVANELALELGWWVYNAGLSTTVISRYPITETFISGWAGVGARIQLSDDPPQDVIVWSAHLYYTPYGPYDVRDGLPTPLVMQHEVTSGRVGEIRAILADMGSQITNADNVPVFLLGDFNTPSHLDWTAATAMRHDGYVVRWPVTRIVQGSGFFDVYRAVWPNPRTHPGFTWSPVFKSSDGLPEPQDRIDMVHALGAGVTAVSAEVYTGPPGVLRLYPNHADNIWPSDHASVVVQVELVPGTGLSLPPIDQPSTTTPNVMLGDDVVVQFDNALGYGSDWIGLYAVGADDLDYLDFTYTGGVVSGTVTLPSPGSPGTYEARLFYDNTYGRMAQSTFEVLGSSPTIGTVAATYTVGDDIVVWWEDAPGNLDDWVGLYEDGAAAGPGSPSLDWAYTGGAIDGSLSFSSSSLAPGAYEGRLFINDTYDLLATCDFELTP